MLQDGFIIDAPAMPIRDGFRDGARPFGARAMTEQRPPFDPTEVTAHASGAPEAPLGSFERPISTMAEPKEWVDATAPAQAIVDKRRAELMEALIHKPFGMFGI